MVRLISGLAYLALFSNTIDAVSLPDSDNALNILEAHAGSAPRSADIVAPENALERRKGGGGRGGGSSGGGSSGGGSGGRGGSGGGGSRTSGASNVGGQTRSGSGTTRGYGGGAYYAGGAAVPYQAGQKSSKNGLLAAPLLVGAGALAIMPGLWLYSAYPYYYNNPYRFYNRTANATDNNNNNNARDLVTRQQQMGANQTLDVICLCQEFSVCGCEENDDQKYLNDLVGNGSYAALNKSVVTVSEVNNTRKLVLNGTLPNGTTAPGGEDDAGASLSIGGYWVMCLVVLYGVML